MTSHRLLRCSLAVAVSATTVLGHRMRVERARVGRAQWQERAPAHWISWTLELEQGATGVLAHLSARPVSGPLASMPPRLGRVVLQPLAVHKLTQLAAHVAAAVDQAP